MEKSDIWDDIVIGAGYSGLSLASLLAKHNRRVCVLESHSVPGGCASYFRRSGFHFDVGATTLSGLGENMPLDVLKQRLGIKFNAQRLEEPMIITLSNGIKLNRYADTNLWINELNQKFPGVDHATLWNQLEKLSKRAWALLSETWNFPPESLLETIKLLKPKLLKEADLSFYMLCSLNTLLPSFYKTGVLRQFIDEQLLISTQSYSEKVPALIGALGLTYPSDMYYPKGGITSFAIQLADYLKQNGGSIEYTQAVRSIESVNQHLMVITNNENTYRSKRVISTIPIWNCRSFHPALEKWVSSMEKNYEDSWSAITMNFAIKPVKPIEHLYHQIHLDKPILNAASNSLFFSLSSPNDESRAPKGWQTVTVSTHALFKSFPHPDDSNYKSDKAKIAEQILEIFNKYIAQTEDIKFVSVGTPHTFVRYTNRFQGRVGGIAHSVDLRPWNWPKHHTPLDNFYHSGDTSFPGQGIVGVIQGSLNFMNRHHQKD